MKSYQKWPNSAKLLSALVAAIVLIFTSTSFASTQVYNLSTGTVFSDTNSVSVTTSMSAINFTVSSSSACATNESAIYAFDGNVNTKYCFNATPFGSNVLTLHYLNAVVNPLLLGLTTASDSEVYPERNPLSWKLYGSNDGATWTLIRENTYSDFLVPTYNVTDYNYDSFLDYQGYHSYLKFEITNTLSPTNTTQFSELKILGNYNYVATCSFKGNSASAKNSVGQSKASSAATTKSNGGGACQNASSR